MPISIWGPEVLRIANPGADIDSIVRIFRDIYSHLKDRADFDLDDMSRSMVDSNNVSSHGAFGEEALRRSTRKDRSRDGIYNQSKMYAEIYRTLGWIQSTSAALRFAFSWLGEHVAQAGDPKPLTVECLLGMAYPNDVLGAQDGHAVRVFSAILATAKALGGGITRDEMIVGPLSFSDDRDPAALDAMLARLRRCRSERGRMEKEIEALSVSRGISHVTMGNYTRFPIAAVQWAGWAKKTSRSMLTLTDVGQATIGRLATLQDVRLSDYKAMPASAKAPFLRLTAHLMLERAGFDLSPALEDMEADRGVLKAVGVPTDPDPWFSPFQQVARAEVNAAFPHLGAATHVTVASARRNISQTGAVGRTNATATVIFSSSGVAPAGDAETTAVKNELAAHMGACGEVARAIESFAAAHSSDNQDVFYPLVAALFRIIGYECRISRRGVNYDRADAMIVDTTRSIPIEIKSPGEETEISVKAIRQAVENKVILLSRRQFPTRLETTTLVVGFNAPNERSEVRELVGDVHLAFGFNVGVMDFRTLAGLALRAAGSEMNLVLTGFDEMKGVANVANLLAP